MKSTAGLLIKKSILALTVLFVAAGGAACTCGEPASDTTYKLIHSAADAEYILSWDSIVSECPDIGACDKQENFVHRGETAQTGSGAPVLEEDSPAAWVCLRGVTVGPVGNSFRSFGVWIMYFDIDEYLDEYVELIKTSGIPLQEEGDYWTAVLESGPPTESVQLHIAGNQFYILLTDVASSDESLFFGKEKLMELVSTIQSNISSLEITPLPADIPERIVVEDTYEWHEFTTFRSDELPPPVRVPEEEFYNDLWFVDRPLMQVFNFVIDKDWRFVMTATGEIDTKFEVYATVTASGEQGFSYSSDHPFNLYSETVTFTREQPIERGYEPPVNVEIKVFLDQPISWTFTVEK